MKTILLITIVLLNISAINAQFVPEWVQTHSLGTTQLYTHYVDQNDNYYSTSNISHPTEGFNLLTLKFNSTGQLMWSKTYNSSLNNDDMDVAVFSDLEGNVYVFCNSYSNNYATCKFVMLKYDSNGGLLNTYTYQRPGMVWTLAQKVIFENNSDFVATGFVYNSSFVDSIITYKINKNGTVAWIKTISGNLDYDDYSFDVVSDPADNLYVVGQITNTGFGVDMVTIKYNSAGVLQWQQTYRYNNNSINERAFGIALDNTQNVYVTGRTDLISGLDSSQTTILKYNSLGQLQWANNYNIANPGSEEGQKIFVSSNDIYAHVVSTDGQRLLKVNSNGIQQWVYSYQNTPYYIALNNSNRLIISGTQNGYFRKALSFQQINPAGTVDFTYKYNYATTGNDAGGFFKDLGNNQYFVVGTHDTLVMMLKLGQGTSNTASFARTGLSKPISDNQITYDTIAFNLDALPPNTYISNVSMNIDTILHTATGDLEISLLHNGQVDTLIYRRGGPLDNFIGTMLNDTATQFMCSSGNSPFTGYYSPCKPFSQLNNFPATGPWVLKIYDRRSPDTGVLKSWSLNVTYQTLIGLTQVSAQVPKTYLLSQNYPNPFNPVTKIKFSVPKSSIVKIIIFDLLGREIETIVDQQLNPGEYETDFDGSNLSSGVYFYKLITDNFSESRKMLMIK